MKNHASRQAMGKDGAVKLNIQHPMRNAERLPKATVERQQSHTAANAEIGKQKWRGRRFGGNGQSPGRAERRVGPPPLASACQTCGDEACVCCLAGSEQEVLDLLIRAYDVGRVM